MLVSAIIVTFNPIRDQLTELIAALHGAVARIFIIDNASKADDTTWLESFGTKYDVKLTRLVANIGIAAAQNMGISQALKEPCDCVVLFDHDSKPSHNMISILKKSIEHLESSGIKVAAVGPRYFDARQNNPPPFIEVQGIRVIRKRCDCDSSIVPVSYVIASGSLIPVATLNEVGLMKEELFIDYVDIEWGLRAAQFGYKSFGVCNAFMEHDLGEDPINFFGKSVPLHSPLRHYYLFRNAVYLYKQSYLPTAWKLGDFYRLMLKYGFYTFFAKPRWKHFSMMTKGMLDGLLGRMGKYSGI